MIKIWLEFELKTPYRMSIDTLLAFCSMWHSTVLYGGTNREKAIISISSPYFKKIFKMNPEVKSYPVPSGMGGFVASVKVRKILAK